MSANHHTDISAGAAASAATINAPLGQLDAKLTHAVTEYADATNGTTTVTTNGTYYAVSSFEISFTPAYAGQVFLIAAVCGRIYPNTAGDTTWVVRIVDSTNTTIVDNFIRSATTHGTTSTYLAVSGTRAWTAGAGDVGVTRKAKVYVTHTVNGTVVNMAYKSLQAITH